MLPRIANANRLLARRSLLLFQTRHPNAHAFSTVRFVSSFIRLPVTIVGAGAGAFSYIHHKINEITSNPTVEWFRNSLNSAGDYFGDIANSISQLEFKFFDGSSQPDVTSNFSQNQNWANSQQAEVKPPPPVVSSVLNDDNEEEEPDLEIRSNNDKKKGAPDYSSLIENHLMLLTKKLIEIRNLLKTIHHDNDCLQLPSIVVIGSQSSGKSSVLEAIVGHEFLPKGNNMVTRRPIELTLINTPDSVVEYGEFPQLGTRKVTDFKEIQKTLLDMNLEVPSSNCISTEPIELRIYSPAIPNLTLVDLPGYIQINAKDQPEDLKDKISTLCKRYIEEPNIILAVSPADVDLANSEALNASRRVDPQGKRTIGVITKMDLVKPEVGRAILQNKNYPLHLGYIGVVCKPNLRNRKEVLEKEDEVLYQITNINKNIDVGIQTLRRRLVDVLEESMSRSLQTLVHAVGQEYQDTCYQFKVQYNDRTIQPDAYVAECLDTFKSRFKQFSKAFSKPQIRDRIRSLLQKQVVEICEDIYWGDAEKVQEMTQTEDSEKNMSYWETRLQMCSSTITKSGIGRTSVQLVLDTILRHMQFLISQEPFSHHPDAREKVFNYCKNILQSRSNITVDQVENTIKPYKLELDYSPQEWKEGVQRAQELIENEMYSIQSQMRDLIHKVGRKELRNVVQYVLDQEKMQVAEESSHFQILTPLSSEASQDISQQEKSDLDTGKLYQNNYSDSLIEKAHEALQLRERSLILKSRLHHISSSKCSSPNKCNPCLCPEVYLSVLVEKLTYTSTLFLYTELLYTFYNQLPSHLDNRLFYNLSRDELLKFANQNPHISKQLELQNRKQALEMVMEKLTDLVKKQEEVEVWQQKQAIGQEDSKRFKKRRSFDRN